MQARLRELLEKSAKDIVDLQELEKQVEGKSLLIVKFLIFALLCQFALLYYITYYAGGWDVGEPVAYLIGVALDIVGTDWSHPRYRLLPEEEEGRLPGLARRLLEGQAPAQALQKLQHESRRRP
jgi:hypothetical protein